MHLQATIRHYLERPNQTRRNRLNEEVDFINALALPRFYVQVDRRGAIRVFVFDVTINQFPHFRPMPRTLHYAAHEIFESAGDGSFIITKSRERENGLRVNGEGHELQADHSE